jgi:hypothetical protein
MEASRVVISEKDGMLMVSFYDVTVYASCGSSYSKHEQPDLVLVIEAPYHAKLGVITDKELYSAFLPFPKSPVV